MAGGNGHRFQRPVETIPAKVFLMIPTMRFVRRGLSALAGAALAASLVSGAAMAQTKPADPKAAPAATGPTATTATYGDWVVRCAVPPGKTDAEKVCETAEGIQVQGREGLLAQVVFGRLSKDAPWRLIIQLPNGVFIPEGATFFLTADAKQDDDSNAGIKATFKRCTEACFADVELTADQMADLKAAKGPGRIEFVDGNRQRIAIPISFAGLPGALDAAANPH